MPTLVTIRVSNDVIPPARVPGAVVSVFTTAGVYVTEGTTGGNGEVVFDLPDASYDLTFYKAGFATANPQRIVVDSLLTNVFLVTGHQRVRPEGPDPSLCRVSGSMIDPSGHIARYGMISFKPVADIIICRELAMVPGSMTRIKPTPDGYYEFDLLRSTNYYGYFEQIQQLLGSQDTQLDIRVPGVASVDLATLLFPIPLAVTLTQDGDPISDIDLAVGGAPDDSVKIAVGYNDGSTRLSPPAWGAVEVANDSPLVVSAELAVDTLVLRPLTAGVAQVSFIRKLNAGMVYLPDPPEFTSETLTVTVS
jgi:hypothetical protein